MPDFKISLYTISLSHWALKVAPLAATVLPKEFLQAKSEVFTVRETLKDIRV